MEHLPRATQSEMTRIPYVHCNRISATGNPLDAKTTTPPRRRPPVQSHGNRNFHVVVLRPNYHTTDSKTRVTGHPPVYCRHER